MFDTDEWKIWGEPLDRQPSTEPTWGKGYCPHAFMERFKCPRCGSVHFKCYPQSAPADRSKTWTYEYVCAKCGQGMGLTRVGDERMTIFKEWKSCICPNCGTICECIRNLVNRDIRIACPNCLSDYTIHCNYDFEEYSWDKWKKDARPGRLIPEEESE